MQYNGKHIAPNETRPTKWFDQSHGTQAVFGFGGIQGEIRRDKEEFEGMNYSQKLLNN